MLAMAAVALEGCGCVASNIEYGPRLYGGVRYDAEDLAIERFPVGLLIGILDLPFSFLGDTLYLPVTIPEALETGKETYAEVTLIDGGVVEEAGSDVRDFEAVPKGPLPGDLKPIAGAQVRLICRIDGKLVPCPDRGTAKSGDRGFFSLQHRAEESWFLIRVERPHYRPVEVPVQKLHHLTDSAYWKSHRLLIRMKPE